MLNSILVQDFCPLRTEIATFPIGFRLKLFVLDNNYAELFKLYSTCPTN